MRRERLTGAVRWRRRWLSSKVIVQVEVSVETAHPFRLIRCAPMPGADVEEWNRREDDLIAKAWDCARTTWRDATAEDMEKLSPSSVFVRKDHS